MTSEQFGATPAEINEYGAGLNLWQSIALLQKWAPLISYGRDFVNEVDPYKKSLIVANACEWLASQTQAQADDRLVRMIGDILKTKEGETLVRWCLLQVEAAR
jgi:hypothetical protein